MRSFTAFAVAASLVGAGAINLVQPRGAAPRVVQHNIERRIVTDPLARDRLRRRQAKTVLETLDNEDTLYYANTTIGTPAQSVRLHIDTGSSDSWTNVADSELCSSNGAPCSVSGTYAPNSSSTYRYLNSQFEISYVDGSGSAGDYVEDTVRFGGVTLDNQQFGIGYTSSVQDGIMGIGYPINEDAAHSNNALSYPNVPQRLQQDGYISTNAYSLWLNDLDASTGTILFGGVDTDKYTGELQTLPIVPEQGVYVEFMIAMTAVGLNGNSGSLASNIAVAALLDSGSSFLYLPDDIAESIYDALGAHYDASQQAAIVDCSFANNDSTLDFTFSSPTISISMAELVFVAAVEQGSPVCVIGILPAGASSVVLGDAFLRSAYVVYDLTNNEISLAQTAFNSTTDNILEISSSSVPSATHVANPTTSVAVQTGGARIKSPSIKPGAGVPRAAPAVGYTAAMAAAGACLFVAAL